MKIRCNMEALGQCFHPKKMEKGEEPPDCHVCRYFRPTMKPQSWPWPGFENVK